jgi:DNA polymerase
MTKARHGLAERTFVACDAIKRLWRAAHPQISSYWKELENTVTEALLQPGVTFPCRKVKVRCDGGWLRIGLPSARALCYPSARIEPSEIPSKNDPGKPVRNPHAGQISYVGLDQYTRQWGRVYTYGGKLFENITQAAACDQLAECMPLVEDAGYGIVLSVHDELVSETPDTDEYTADGLAALMCSDLGWNKGLPLAAAGFECYRYRKE